MNQIKRVRVGVTYVYRPCLMDKIDPPYGVTKGLLREGDAVTVTNLPGCPKANTMGMCFVTRKGEFAGLVCTGSLCKK